MPTSKVTMTQQNLKLRKRRKAKFGSKKSAKRTNIRKHHPDNFTKTTESKSQDDKNENDSVQPQSSEDSQNADSQMNEDTEPHTSLLQEDSVEENSRAEADDRCVKGDNQASEDVKRVSLVHNIDGRSDTVTTETRKLCSDASLNNATFDDGGFTNQRYPPETQEQLTTVQIEPAITLRCLKEAQPAPKPASYDQSDLDQSSQVIMLPESQQSNNDCDSCPNEAVQCKTDLSDDDAQSQRKRCKSSQNAKVLFLKQQDCGQCSISESREASELCISCDLPHDPCLGICPPWLEALETARFRRINGLDQLNECSSEMSPVSIEDFEWPNFPGVGFPRARSSPKRSGSVGSAAQMLMNSLLKHMKTFSCSRKNVDVDTNPRSSAPTTMDNGSAYEARVWSGREHSTSMAGALLQCVVMSFTWICYALVYKLGWFPKKKT